MGGVYGRSVWEECMRREYERRACEEGMRGGHEKRV
jgi:hypothetical protein